MLAFLLSNCPGIYLLLKLRILIFSSQQFDSNSLEKIQCNLIPLADRARVNEMPLLAFISLSFNAFPCSGDSFFF